MTPFPKSCLLSEVDASFASPKNFSFMSKSCSKHTIVVGDSVTVTQSESTREGIVSDVTFDEQMLPSDQVRFSDGSTNNFFKEALSKCERADIGIVPRKGTHLSLHASLLPSEDLEYILCPDILRDLTLESTLEAKAACEKVYSVFCHKIRHYRADNGRYADKRVMDDIARCNQRISFCGVGVHHQNAIAEREIKEL